MDRAWRLELESEIFTATQITSDPLKAKHALTNDLRKPQNLPLAPGTRYSFIAPGCFQYLNPILS
jgi:hypothetical protein